MASSAASIALSNTSNSLFRIWGKAICDALIAGGFVQTADSSQIDWSTVTVPSNNTDAGYVMFRSNDAGGGLDEFYLKLKPGQGSSTARPRLTLQGGWGSDGSGGLTGTPTAEVTFLFGNDGSTTPQPWFFCVDGDGIVISMNDQFNSGASQHWLLNIERVRDKTGAMKNQVWFWGNSRGSVIINQVLLPSGVTNNDINISSGWRAANGASSYVQGSNNGVGTIAPQVGAFCMEAIGILVGHANNFTSHGQQYVMDVYGIQRRYILTANTNGSLYSLAGSNHRFLLRHD